jgi:hypothetical protein
MSEMYDVITKTTFTDFIRKNKEIKITKEDKESGSNWIKDFLGNNVYVCINAKTDEILGIKRYGLNCAFLILYILVAREDALIMTEYDPRFYDGLISDGVTDPYLNYRDSTQAFLDFVSEDNDCQEWLRLIT